VALRSSAPILKGKVDSGDLQVIGGYYSLDSGAVTVVNGKSPKDGQSFEFRRDHVQGRVQRATLDAFLLGWQPFQIGNRVVTILYLMQQTLAL
jgi:hypothetical protein